MCLKSVLQAGCPIVYVDSGSTDDSVVIARSFNVERDETQWADVLHWLFSYRTSERLSIPDLGLYEANLASRAGRAVARGLLHRHLLECSHDDRTPLLSEAVIDLFSRQIVGWSMQPRMKKELVIDALRMAWFRRHPAPGLIFHSDRGSQYCSAEFQAALAAYGMRSSMSRKGDCWDNAPTESLWGSLYGMRKTGARSDSRGKR